MLRAPMTPNDPYRQPDLHAAIEAARRRAQAAYTELTAVAQEIHRINYDLIRKGGVPVVVGQFSAPAAPPGAAASPELVRLFDGQAEWYAGECARLRATLDSARGELHAAMQPPAALAPAPRAVPLSMALAELTRVPWRWLRYLLFPPFTMLAGTAVGGLQAVHPAAGFAALTLGLAALWIHGIRVGLKRVRLLAMGEVATVLQRVDRTGAARNRNVPMLRARGWNVAVEFYTGMSRITDLVVQSSRGATTSLTVRHGPAFDGVILVDPETQYACANLDLGSCPQPDHTGQWTGVLSPRVWLTSLAGVVTSAGLVVAALSLLPGLERLLP